ncbi:reverse transcriptase domain-containing protein [Tanacetum coccineum]|uniref:Reverse transcriptase domain-containing protein n=1 Tax=Tanacetum coccineum TaxID=301880 RepID=A0ABQ4ZYM3_9ASTR
MLTAPEEQEELIIYLAATKEAVSVVLMTEREARQMPIYFVSRALWGPEVNYTSMEKLVLALVHASKRLRRTVSPRRQRRSRSPRHSPSVFTRLRRERSRSPRHKYKSKVNKRITSVQRREQRKSGNTSVHYPIAVQESQDTRKNTLQAKRSEDGTVEV